MRQMSDEELSIYKEWRTSHAVDQNGICNDYVKGEYDGN
jgi:hypothetical protein